MPARQSRLANGYEAAKKHIKLVTERVKGAAEKFNAARKGKLPGSNVEQVSKHKVKQQKADAGAQTQTKAKTQTKPQTPPPPGPRRGR